MYIDYPWHFDERGRTAESTRPDHIRDMVEQVLFTAPGERVNRPDFGTGLLQLVHDTNSAEVASTVESLAHSALERWLGDLIAVDSLTVSASEATLTVDLTYTVRQTGDQQSNRFRLNQGATS